MEFRHDLQGREGRETEGSKSAGNGNGLPRVLPEAMER